MVNQCFIEIKYRVGLDDIQTFNCRREELKPTIEMLKEYNEGFKLIKVTPWRINLC